MINVICLGELLIDMVCNEKDTGLVDGKTFIKAPGGAPANVAVAISRLGLRCGFIGKVGEDPFGNFLIHLLRKELIDVSYLEKINGIRTTIVFVGNKKDQTKDMVFYRNPGADMFLSSEQINEQYFKDALVFHFGSISLIDEKPREATQKAIKLAKKNNLIITYDPNYREDLWRGVDDPKPVMRSILKDVDIVKVSNEEWEIFTGVDNFIEGSKTLIEEGVKIVIISMGSEGCFYYKERFNGYVKGFKVNVVETTGAGDAFMGAIISWLITNSIRKEKLESLSEKKVKEMLRFANAAGAIATTKIGAIPSLPKKEEIERFLINN